ncbi:hypothetical protein M433DRAFT_136457 [Acidomyces richmondensis BFW]|nr:hypothetical protein M433DRAFT_136457 [Acidomyces richmondensis BFW]
MAAGRWFKNLLTSNACDCSPPGFSKDDEERRQDFRAQEEERMSVWRVLSVGYENVGEYVDVSEWVSLCGLGASPYARLTDAPRLELYEVSVRELRPCAHIDGSWSLDARKRIYARYAKENHLC